MARIRFYPEDNNLHPSDHIVGTDEVTGNGATRVFTVQALSDFIATSLEDVFIRTGDEIPDDTPIPDDIDMVSDTIVQQRVLCPAPILISTGGTEDGGIIGYDVYGYRTTLGVNQIQIITRGNTFIYDTESLVGVGFTGVLGSDNVTGTISSYDGLLGEGDSFVPGTTSHLFTVTDIAITFPTGLDQATEFGTFTITDDVYKFSTGLGGETIIGGDLILEGDIIVDGEPIDLSSFALQVDVDNSIQSLTELINGKADIGDLHPPASVNTASAPEGVALTAITGISIDPATQAISVTRGTVPVITGDIATAMGGTVVTINGQDIGDLNINTGDSAGLSQAVVTAVGGEIQVYYEASGFSFDLDASIGNIDFDVDANNVVSANLDISGKLDTSVYNTFISTLGDIVTDDAADFATADHTHALADLSNVNDDIQVGIENGSVLFWDEANSQWDAEPSTDVTGVENLGDLLDVTLGDLQEDQFLRYDGSVWFNETVESVLTYDSSDEERRVNDSLQGDNPGAQIPVAQPDTYGLVKLDASAIRTVEACTTPTTQYTLQANGSTVGESVPLTSIGSFDGISLVNLTTAAFTLDGVTVHTENSGPAINMVLNAAGNPDFAILDQNQIDLSTGAQDVIDGEGYYRYVTDVFDVNAFSAEISFPTPVPAGSYNFIVALGTQIVNEICIDASVDVTGDLTINGHSVTTTEDSIAFSDDDVIALNSDTDRVFPILFTDTPATDDDPRTITARVNAGSLEFDIMHGDILPGNESTNPTTPFDNQLFVLDTEDPDGRRAGLYRYNGNTWVVVATHSGTGDEGVGIQYIEQSSSAVTTVPVGSILEGLDGLLYINQSSAAVDIQTSDDGSGFYQLRGLSALNANLQEQIGGTITGTGGANDGMISVPPGGMIVRAFTPDGDSAGQNTVFMNRTGEIQTVDDQDGVPNLANLLASDFIELGRGVAGTSGQIGVSLNATTRAYDVSLDITNPGSGETHFLQIDDSGTLSSALASPVSIVRASFNTDSSVTSGFDNLATADGTVNIVHDLDLATPFTVIAQVYDSTGSQVLPGATNIIDKDTIQLVFNGALLSGNVIITG